MSRVGVKSHGYVFTAPDLNCVATKRKLAPLGAPVIPRVSWMAPSASVEVCCRGLSLGCLRFVANHAYFSGYSLRHVVD
jgi:hypothetical protein